ncbi:hypothetical protein jhhlp_005471 [Lomentospora prolificans]|uniref:Uncharacterized protein n=1 Tax=Lomentospora prolificans TaxID=41688 RepID=A0A2N3N6Y4_9PEZI|nr:hypothetical protein jhhlp_005471 [Lomentospora prolificans]
MDAPVPAPDEVVVAAGTYTPHGCLTTSVGLAKLAKNIRHTLYIGPIDDGHAIASLERWLDAPPTHLHLTISVPPFHRRQVAMLHFAILEHCYARHTTFPPLYAFTGEGTGQYTQDAAFR